MYPDDKPEVEYNAITLDHMTALADAIDEYVGTVNDIFIMPKKLYNPKSKEIKEAMRLVDELIRELRAGNKDAVFKDDLY